MVKTITILLMLLTVPAWSVTRPPDLEPIYLPLEADVQTAQDLLKAEAEK